MMNEEFSFDQVPLEHRYNLILSFNKKLLREIENLEEKIKEERKEFIRLEHYLKNSAVMKSEADFCTLLHDIKTLDKTELHKKYKEILKQWLTEKRKIYENKDLIRQEGTEVLSY